MRVTVQDGWQIKHGGKMRTAGDTFDAPDKEAAAWIASGLAVKATATKKVSGSKNKATTSAQTSNKAATQAKEK